MLDQQRRHRLINSFIESHDEETAMALAESLFSVDHATKDDIAFLNTRIDQCATKDDIAFLNTRIDQCATKDDVALLNARVDQCATKTDLENYATKDDLKAVETRLGHRIELMGAGLRTEINASAKSQLKWFIGSMIGFLTLTFTSLGITTAVILNTINNAAI